MSELLQKLPCVCGQSKWERVADVELVSLKRCRGCARLGFFAAMWSQTVFFVAENAHQSHGFIDGWRYWEEVIDPIWRVGAPAYFRWYNAVCEVDQRISNYCANCLRLPPFDHPNELGDKDYRRFAHSFTRAKRLKMFEYSVRPEEFAVPLPFLPRTIRGFLLKHGKSDSLWGPVDHDEAAAASIPAWMEPALQEFGFAKPSA